METHIKHHKILHFCVLSDMKNSRQGMETSIFLTRTGKGMVVRHEEFPSGNGNLSSLSVFRLGNSCQTWRIPVREWKQVPVQRICIIRVRSDMKNSRQGMETNRESRGRWSISQVRHEEFPSGNGNIAIRGFSRTTSITSQTWRIPVREWKR